jgi:hypothetical protein
VNILRAVSRFMFWKVVYNELDTSVCLWFGVT